MGYEIRLSVRELVEFLLQSGSIDSRFSGVDRALEGAELHRRLQKAEGGLYRAEVPLSLTRDWGEFTYAVEGRADGIFEAEDLVTVDEIKTTTAPPELITADWNPVHWAQAECYAYFYALQENLPRMGVRLTYYQTDLDEIRRFSREYGFAELEAFYLELLREYDRWARLRRDWEKTRGDSLRELGFPFPAYRPGQREFAAAVYHAASKGERMLCQAPTGIGKTMSALFPAVKAMGTGKAEKLFYLTAKTVARQAAENALALLREKGMRLKTVTLTAKDKICFLEERECTPQACPYADGHYDRAPDALFDLLTSRDGMTREAVEETARSRRVCPFELSLSLTDWCDAVICDYNYLFDPSASLKRFFAEGKGEYVFLIDEAHNLVDRARDMYSAALRKSEVLALHREARRAGDRSLARALSRVNAALLALRKQCGEQEVLASRELPEGVVPALSYFCADCGEWLEKHREGTLHRAVLPFYFEARFFLKIAELFDERYLSYTVLSGREVTLKLLCLDPSALLDGCLKHGRAAVLFSATLSPPDYFRSVLGCGEARSYALPSPFPRENLLLLLASGVSTRYRDRERSLGPVARLLREMAGGKPGNYLCYFPSYQYLGDVLREFRRLFPEVETLEQTPDMSEGEKDAFLARFGERNPGTLLGFCVLGGSYAEGIDLRGDRLSGAAVVGVGLPQVNPEQELLREYYDRKNGMGFEFAYQYPGMNKVLQAAGRVIRSETDRGVVLLIDSRFARRDYQPLFPPHWRDRDFVRGPEDLKNRLREFWK